MRSRNSGSALILVIIVSSVLLLAALGASLSSISDIGVTQDEKIKTELELACESGINRAKSKVDMSFNSEELDALEPVISFQGTEADDTDKTPEEKAYDDETFTEGNNVDFYEYTVKGTNNKDITVRYTITEDQDWTKNQAITEYDMNIEAVAFAPGVGWQGMSENASVRRSTLFKYAVFYNDKLEILPGANFNLKGLIHTNENLHLNSEATLSIQTDCMSAAGEIFRGRYNTTASDGTVRISKKNEDGAYQTMGKSPKQDATKTDWVDFAKATWEGAVKDKHLGATKQSAPSFKSFAPDDFYDQNAGLRIKVIAKNQTTPTYEIEYNDTPITNTALGNALSETTFFDRRESSTKIVKTTQLDVAKLKASPYWPDNGLIYMTRDDAVKDSDGNQYAPDPNKVVTGVKLTNGSELGDSMTMVSDLPVYVQGDFNLHTSSDPNTDKWEPAAIIADAITVLSNSWSDANTKVVTPATAGTPAVYKKGKLVTPAVPATPETITASTTKYAASNTTVNSVFVSGDTPSNASTGQYSGGFENFPRLLESWSNKTLTIKGSFIQLFRSQYATGLWGGSNYYDAALRNWSSEERFADNLEDLPPGFTDLFPSTNFGVTYNSWNQISKDESNLALEE